MAAAGFSKGFDVKLSTFSTPLDFPAMAALIQSYLKQININVNIVAQDPGDLRREQRQGRVRDGPDRARHARRRRRLRRPSSTRRGAFGKTVYSTWFSGYKNEQMWRLVGNGRITLDPKKRLPMYQKLDRLLMTELLEIPLVSVSKYQVVNAKLQNMYVAFTDFNTGPPDGLARA